ncbi:hypothetical protein QN386_01975 [Pseudomonas sp. CCI3.2]|uniref:hypothetical protein n=1 Tax=unclassified Pseudomonas TaxID=196821 RepID=UPI002AC9ADC5|nr:MULTISPECIES: hypothetical protein [unclassified Pseudomonas]MEB0076102.1 hypothetical protein [Pseudomonas sp. MH10out]MEB0090792.1 hypothetical protein [Pseudomonas sp. CCI4.2]MEB0100098.1 hypothetical protein [Pseudomonas sp. CCI3.2]MEB0132057.1 hypothetical protein [Pseudomonas sp. CCI2.4]MEB0156145.1 hypothetical protein [Pseudomonas sp. AH2 (2023)]
MPIEHQNHPEDRSEIEALHLKYVQNFDRLHDEAMKFQDAAYSLGRLRGQSESFSQWAPIAARLPTHLHSVLGWVITSPLVMDDPFADSVSYDPNRGVWLQCVAGEDAIVGVSHWMPLPASPKVPI